jgi:formylglycine-generating enzyme required for sulfatase activity
MKTFKELQGKIKVEDSVIIFYAGHGYLDKSSNNGFWVPVDGGIDENVQERWISNSIIRGFISQMKSKHILLISDSCFSGDLLDAWREKSPKITHEYFKRAYKRRSRQVLTSGASERVPDNSEFAIQLKLALQENGKPYLDPLSIYNEIRWGIKDTLPMFGYLKGTNHQEGGAFLFFLKDKKTDKPADVIAVESKTGRKAYKNNKDYWEIDHGDGIIMVYIPAGEFTMGSNDGGEDEKPPHKVRLDGYWMGKKEVTVKQYKSFISESRYQSLPSWVFKYSPGDEYPIVGVSWGDAKAYCKVLSKEKGLTFKLPTEAQWEKAARGTGPDVRRYPWGNRPPSGEKVNFADKNLWEKEKWSWADKNIDDGYAYTAPVGSYPQGASPYGLLDMAGNVWERCSDWYDSGYYKNAPKNNPKGPEGGTNRVVRGGSWYNDAVYLRCAYRVYDGPSYRYDILGFRLCQDNK